ncbi:MAG: sel1 repeat family protein [Gloeobacteraceae cyanobacterium ES-bin-144]|nr:sel1 repeat family protein [Verrucomicrobiales bacterium]
MKISFIITAASVFAFCISTDIFAGTDAALQKETVKKNLRLAESGDAVGQLGMGIAYDSGIGVEKNLAKALDWYRKAAAQGNGDAMIQIARHYENGSGVEKSIATAAEWFQKVRSMPAKSEADWHLTRLSRARLIKEKYVGISIEGGFLGTLVDESVPIPEALKNLAANPDEIQTGKGYWIGFNPQMLSVGARGEAAIPFLLDFIKQASDPKVRYAGLLALHLVGIECVADLRFGENFKNRKAREAMWELMKIEGLTDEVSMLLKRDPWPADVPAIMEALAVVKDDCPRTLNALLRYPLAKRPVDTGFNGMGVSFTIPKQYTVRDFVRLAIEGIKANSWVRVEVEDGMLEQIPVHGYRQSREPTKWEGTLDKLLAEIKDLTPVFDFDNPGREVYYYLETSGEDKSVLHFLTAASAKKRWLEWWQTSGRAWYCGPQ